MLNIPTVALLSLLLLPLAISITTSLPGRHRPGTVLNPKQASAVDAAVARVLTAGAEYSGNTIKLPCRECGRRQIPPVEQIDSPWIPTELATLVGTRPGGWQITATCTECYGPLISRVLDEQLAHHAVSIGVVEALQVDR